jgi:CelD/BcsL family acetyltransferase involved in cellulose biosynthesis
MTSYDERFRECAPGHLLTERLAEHCVEAGLRELDFLGCDLEWKRAWTRTTREHSWLFLFRDSPSGALLARAKFTGVPALRRRLARPFGARASSEPRPAGRSRA